MTKRLRARRRLAGLPAGRYATTDKGRVVRRTAAVEAPPLSALVQASLSRRGLLLGSAATVAALALPGGRAEAAESSAGFSELARVMDERDHIAAGYDRQVLLSWGDAILHRQPRPSTSPRSATDRPPSAEFGFNNDFTAFLPLPRGSRQLRPRPADRPATNMSIPDLMFPGLTDEDFREKLTDAQIRTIMAATGRQRRRGERRTAPPGRW